MQCSVLVEVDVLSGPYGLSPLYVRQSSDDFVLCEAPTSELVNDRVDSARARQLTVILMIACSIA